MPESSDLAIFVLMTTDKTPLAHARGVIIQWNLSITDILGTAESVLISEVSTFQG